MKKQEFLIRLQSSLKQFRPEEVKEIVSYYDEMISDKLEENPDEEAVIAGLGDINTIITKIQSDLVDKRINMPGKKGIDTKDVALVVTLLFASPILIPIGIAFCSVIFSIFITAGALIIAFGATAISLIIALIPGVIYASMAAGAPGGVLAAGVITLLIGIFAMLTVVLLKSGELAVKGTVKLTMKIKSLVSGGKK